jgi:hypothetical protein
MLISRNDLASDASCQWNFLYLFGVSGAMMIFGISFDDVGLPFRLQFGYDVRTVHSGKCLLGMMDPGGMMMVWLSENG